jgi:anti-anti-sigma factor
LKQRRLRGSFSHIAKAARLRREELKDARGRAMATPQGIVRFHQHEQTLTFRVEGRATMPHSVPLRSQVDRSMALGVTRILIDLRDCVYMDSTFLGTLLALSKILARKASGQFLLISPSQGCRQLFQQMGLSALFVTENADLDPNVVWQDLPVGQPDVGSLKRNVAQAHEELANLPGKAGEQFRVVAECMARAAEAEKPTPTPSTPADR